MDTNALWYGIRRIEGSEIDRILAEEQLIETEKSELFKIKQVKNLYQSYERSDPNLSSLILKVLEEKISGRFRGEIISLVSLIYLKQNKEINEIKKELLRHSKEMCENGEEEPKYKLGLFKANHSFLWDAIKAYSNIVNEDESIELLYFLQDKRLKTTQQVTLQGLQCIFGSYPPSSEYSKKTIPDLCERVDYLSNRYSEIKFLDESPEQYILGYNAIVVSILLGNDNSIYNFRNLLNSERGISQFIKRQLQAFNTQHRIIQNQEDIRGVEYINQAVSLVNKKT